MNLHEQARAAVLEADEYMANHRVTDSWRVISRLHGVLVRLMDEAATRTRVVTTVPELDALPVGSVVLDVDEEAWQKPDALDTWVSGQQTLALTSAQLAADGPFRVLYEPEEDR